MSTIFEKKDQVQPLRCPKGMKLPSYVKAMSASIKGSKADRRYYMRLMGIAIHEMAIKSKNASRTERATEQK